jgi:Carboxypeptidase regulatory-like domain
MVAVAIAVMSIVGIGAVAAAEPTGSINGLVTDNSGNPIAGARVDAWEWDFATHEGRDYTDLTGHYSITGLGAEDYRVKAYADGYNAYYYPGVLKAGDAEAVHVDDGQEDLGHCLPRGRIHKDSRGQSFGL